MIDLNFYKFVLELVKDRMNDGSSIIWKKPVLKYSKSYPIGLSTYMIGWFNYFNISMCKI